MNSSDSTKCAWLIAIVSVAILCTVQLAYSGQGDISGPWKTAEGELLLIDRLTAGGWRLRQVPDGSRHTIMAETDTLYSVTGVGDQFIGYLTIPEDATRLTWSLPGGATHLQAVRVPVEHHEFNVAADDDVTLRGRLTVPAGQAADHLVLLVHGSERTSAIRHFWYRDLFLAHGFSVIVFDKRGTGESGGQFTMNFDRLAADVRSVATAAIQLLDIPPASLGLAGFSQGGWVAPLAAMELPVVDYVLVSYGLVDSPHAEARSLGLIELAQAGLEPDALAEADELLVAALDVVACDYRCGWHTYHRLAHRRDKGNWLRHISDDRVQALLSEPEWRLRIYGPRKLLPLSWHYHSGPVLEHHDIPMAWMIAEADSVAPPDFTIRFLNRMIDQGKPYVLHTYPQTDHGILRFVETNGSRQYHGHDPRYLHDLIQEALRLSGKALP